MARGTAPVVSPVCAYVAERTGSSLSGQQLARLTELLEKRRQRRSEVEYLSFLKSEEGSGELSELMAAISVHKTDLFRDEVQLDAFREQVLRPLISRVRRPLQLWSAGCATGEEVATLLILLAECGAAPGSRVLGTDISEAALARARELTFHRSLFKRVPERLRDTYFRPTGEGLRLAKELSDQASFLRHNLMDAPYPLAPGGTGFDLIFCRNVLIYFTPAAFDQTIDGLAGRLVEGGTLVLSAAEPLLKPHPLLDTVRGEQAFFYVRRDKPVRAAPRPQGELGRPPNPLGAPSAPRFTPATGLPAAMLGVSTAPELPAVPSPGPRPAQPPAPLAAAAAPAPAPGSAKAPAAMDDPLAEAHHLFEQVLEWASHGEGDGKTEAGLRQCLYLDPHFAQARYLLAMLCEQRGERANAAAEYRRALAALNEGRSRPVAFFLNDERLKTACAAALKRLGYPER